ncbi:MAG: hypothetical protein GY950_29010, partial [bacterium]|nr:hypothetical protein [bacterium]
RLEFTQSILQSLIRDRQSINLTGEKGTGKARLLEDMQECSLGGVKIINADLKSYVKKYGGLLREIHRQLGLRGKVPDKLDRLFEGLEKQPVYYLVFLGNYDALLDNAEKDDNYDEDFIDDLNFIKNKDNVSLLCTTCKPHNTLLFFIKGETNRNSWLNLEFEHLPNLTMKQIRDDFERRVEDTPYKQWVAENPREYNMLEGVIHDDELPYARLRFLTKRLMRQTPDEKRIDFEKRVEMWLEEFQKENRDSFRKKLHGLKTEAGSTVKASGLHKVKIPFKSILGFFKGFGK